MRFVITHSFIISSIFASRFKNALQNLALDQS